MDTQRKKRVYALVMILSGFALFVDRCFLYREPASAMGEDPSISLTIPTPAQNGPLESAVVISESTKPTSAAIPQLPFPRKITPFDDAADLRDLFASPGQTFEKNAAHNSSTRVKRSDRLTRTELQAKYHLEGIFLQDGLKVAIISGKWMKIGETVEGCELTALAGNQARFQCIDGEIILEFSVLNTSSPR